MEEFNRKHLKNIQAMVQKETGAAVAAEKGFGGGGVRKAVLLTCSLFCLVILGAFAYGEFSGLDGDDAGFAAVYQGNGRFEIIVANHSDRELKLQDQVKVMQWSTASEVEGNPGEIKMEVSPIAPHSRGIVSIDLSAGYDVKAMEESLSQGDTYYFVLTNHYFAFGQDWMCFFDFEVEQTEEVEARLQEQMKERETREAERQEAERQEAAEQRCGAGSLAFQDWVWPAVSQEVSAPYGTRDNGTFSDHINIAGETGEEVYGVADGVVVKAGLEGTLGNVIVVDLGDGVTVKYGHLKEIRVSEGEEITQGQVIATLGRSGTATGPNLSFAVTVNGEAVDPLAAE